jgi:hypothetical protein
LLTFLCGLNRLFVLWPLQFTSAIRLSDALPYRPARYSGTGGSQGSDSDVIAGPRMGASFHAIRGSWILRGPAQPKRAKHQAGRCDTGERNRQRVVFRAL